MEIKIVKEGVTRDQLIKMADKEFVDLVKAVVDVAQGIMAIGGELHADEETLLTEQCDSKRENLWGINLYPKKTGEDWIEFDSMINLKPQHGNRSRSVEDPATRRKIIWVVQKLVHG